MTKTKTKTKTMTIEKDEKGNDRQSDKDSLGKNTTAKIFCFGVPLLLADLAVNSGHFGKFGNKVNFHQLWLAQQIIMRCPVHPNICINAYRAAPQRRN